MNNDQAKKIAALALGLWPRTMTEVQAHLLAEMILPFDAERGVEVIKAHARENLYYTTVGLSERLKADHAKMVAQGKPERTRNFVVDDLRAAYLDRNEPEYNHPSYLAFDDVGLVTAHFSDAWAHSRDSGDPPDVIRIARGMIFGCARRAFAQLFPNDPSEGDLCARACVELGPDEVLPRVKIETLNPRRRPSPVMMALPVDPMKQLPRPPAMTNPNDAIRSLVQAVRNDEAAK